MLHAFALILACSLVVLLYFYLLTRVAVTKEFILIQNSLTTPFYGRKRLLNVYAFYFFIDIVLFYVLSCKLNKTVDITKFIGELFSKN